MFIINISKEVVPLKTYKSELKEGLIVLKCKDKILVNRNNECLYLDLKSYALAIGISETQLLEFISYSSSLKGSLAYYRDTNYRKVRVLEMKSLDDLSKMLRALGNGLNLQLLKEIKEKVNKILNQIN